MGVTGLWQLIDSAGHPINLESLHNKVIAIDLSLWINQSIKGIRGRNGQTVENAHVLGLFNRICKLLFYKIKPVFVFDGKCPQLKRNTIAKRVEQRLKAVDKSREASIKVLHSYIASQMSSPVKQLPTNDSLPSLQSSLLHLSDNKSFKVYEELAQIERNQDLSESESDSDIEPNIAHNFRDIQNIESMDLNSDEFQSLPPDMKYEILTEMRQKFKGYRSATIMPKETNDFSKYQLQRLLKKRDIQSKIEETIKQLNGDHTEDIIEEWDKKGYHKDSEFSAGQLMSDESTRFVFLKKSQINDSQKCVEIITDNSTKESSIPSNVSTQNDSVNNESIVISDSSDSELEITKEISEKISENYLKTIVNNEQKAESSSNQLFEKTFEVSDNENDVEESNKEIKTVPQKLPENNERNEIIIVLKDERITKNEFTKIKDKELVSDSESDGDFIEVLPQTSHSLEKPNNSELKTNSINFDSNEIQELNEDFEEVVDQKDISNKLIPEVNQMTDISSKQNSSEMSDEPKASSSQIDFKPISREEVLESYREMNKQNRFANQVNDQMMIDCQELLELFGLPFVISPTEAEAQCAALEELGLTEGTITDDSDILLFGAKTVYKNFFTSSKYIEQFNSSDIETRFGLNRSSLICIAMLCGSDYTDGVDGVGTVTATEILSEFKGNDMQPLIDLKNWWQNKRKSKEKRPENQIRAKLLKLKISDSFPNQIIFDAYIKPTVDTSTEKFVWGCPRLDELRSYAALKFGWTLEKCNQTLLPIMKKVNEKQTQMKIDNYFKIQVQPKDVALVSKRVNKAIEKLRGVESEPQTSQTKSKKELSSLTLKVKNQRKRRQTKTDKSVTQSQSKKRLNTKPKAHEINLSESSESD